jgi:hypothetical protein
VARCLGAGYASKTVTVHVRSAYHTIELGRERAVTRLHDTKVLTDLGR